MWVILNISLLAKGAQPKMTTVSAYRIIQILILVIFAAFISDLRRKPNMAPLIDPRLTLLSKLAYPIPTVINFYVLFTLDRLYPVDFFALLLNALGTFLVVQAKRDLGAQHTWAGYGSTQTQLVRHGIYGLIRHPLYTGIYLFIMGSLVLAAMHAPWFLVVIMAVTLGYIMVFLAAAARREERLLAQQFGEAYRAYQAQVQAFLPLRVRKTGLSMPQHVE